MYLSGLSFVFTVLFLCASRDLKTLYPTSYIYLHNSLLLGCGEHNVGEAIFSTHDHISTSLRQSLDRSFRCFHHIFSSFLGIASVLFRSLAGYAWVALNPQAVY